VAAARRRGSSAAQGGAQNDSVSNGQKKTRLKPRPAFILAGEFLLTFCGFEPEKPQV
jgi:hypothetical protein